VAGAEGTGIDQVVRLIRELIAKRGEGEDDGNTGCDGGHYQAAAAGRKVLTPLFTKGSYVKEFSLNASRQPGSPIQYFPVSLFDEIFAHLLEGRSARIGDDYQLNPCTQGAVNEPLERIYHLVPKANIRRNDDIDCLQMPSFQFVKPFLKSGNVHLVDLCMQMQVRKDRGIDVDSSYDGVVSFCAVNSGQPPAAAYLHNTGTVWQPMAPEVVHQQPTRYPVLVAVHRREMEAFEPPDFRMTRLEHANAVSLNFVRSHRVWQGLTS
jgi:hypothetical protein